MIDRKIKILIVEDEAVNAIYLEKSLELGGYFVSEVAEDSRKAVSTFNEDKPDVILMDIKLTGSVDGIETSRIILKRNPGIPIIFMTGFDEEVIRREAMELNPLAFLVKPVRVEHIIELINNHFSKR